MSKLCKEMGGGALPSPGKRSRLPAPAGPGFQGHPPDPQGLSFPIYEVCENLARPPPPSEEREGPAGGGTGSGVPAAGRGGARRAGRGGRLAPGAGWRGTCGQARRAVRAAAERAAPGR